MNLYRWSDILDRKRPMAHARIVRRERYAWPGGYELALLVDDGALLCNDCVSKEFANISHAVRSKSRNGWYPEGIVSGDTMDETDSCAHCGRDIGPERN